MRLEHGSRTTVQLSPLTIRLASLSGVPFTNRLVTKFDLPSVSLRQHSRLEERKRENMIASECSRRSTGEHTDELDSRQRPANRVNSEDAVDDDEYDGLTDWRACGSN